MIDFNKKTNISDQIYEELKEMILTGVLKAGEKMADNTAWSKKYGVSRRTVQMAMAKLEKDGFISKRPRRGTFILTNRPSRIKKKKALKKIGFLLDMSSGGVDNIYFARIFTGCESRAHEMGIDLSLNLIRMEPANYRIPDILWKYEVDGVIIGVVFQKTFKEFFRDVRKSDMPYVLIESSPKENEHAVLADNENGTRMAMNHLLGLGHRDIGFIEHFPDNISVQERKDVFLQVLKENGIKFKEKNFFKCNGNWAEGHKIGMKLNLDSMPTAFFLTSGIMAIGFMDAMKKRNVRIPEELSIISFDNYESALSFETVLTCVDIKERIMGMTAVDMLVDLIRGNNVENIRRNPVELLIRKTTGPAPEKKTP